MKDRPWRGSRNAGDRLDIGIQTSLWNGHLKPSGITPTIVDGIVLTRIALPIIDGLDAYRVFQMPPLISTTGGAPSLSSSATKPRPSWGFTPIKSKALPEMN